MRILLVEDNSDHRELMRLALTGHDATWQVEGVVSGEEALRRLAEGETCDVVFLDYSLPGRDGLEVLEEILRGEAPPPVVMVTGRGDERVAVEAMKDGAYDYVVKGEGYLQRLPVVAQRAMEANRLAMERKQVEETLQESEERFKLSMEATNDGLWDWNVKTDEGYFSPAYYRMLGYAVGAFPAKGSAWKDLIHPDDRENTLRVNMDCIKGRRELFEIEYRMKARNGKWRWILGRGKCIARDEQGRALRLVGTHVDITERKRSEGELRESEERYRAMFKSISDAVFVSYIEEEDSPGCFVQINNVACQRLGYTREELLGLTPRDITTPEEYTRLLDKREKLISKGNIVVETVHVTRDGRQIPVESSVRIFNYLGKRAAIFISRDITERKKAEEVVQRERRLFNDILENLPVMICLMTPDYHVPFANKSYRKLFGKSHGRRCFEYIFQRTEPCPECQSFTPLKTNVPHHWEWDAPNGINLDIYDFPFADADGSPLILEMNIDITERKRAEEEMRNARTQVEELNKHLIKVREDERALISRDIHDELGQSLTALKIDLHWVLENVGGKPAVNKKLHNMLEMVSGTIATVQRIASELRPAILDDLGLSSAIEWYCEEFEKRTGIQCRMDLEDIQSQDPQKTLTLFRVLQEALTNVIRHAHAKNVTIKLSRLNDAVYLEIQDDGIGISQEKKDSKSSLGLIGIHERVRQFGGEFEILFPHNKGTGLRISLPLNE